MFELQSVVKGYISMNSNQLFEKSYAVTPGGVHSPVRSFKMMECDPVFFSEGKGAYITSVEGKKYIDFCQSFGPNILGHRDPDVQGAVCKVFNKVWTLGALDPYSVELSSWLVEKIPFIDKLRFVCSGTEAVMTALRLARAYTGRQKVLKFEGCYHGHVDNMLVKSGSGLAGMAESSSLGVEEKIVENTLVCGLGDLNHVEDIFKKHGDDLSCVILEPLPANYGLLVQEEEYIKAVYNLAKKYGALVIFDEVISGLRVGFTGMAGRLDLTPDIVTYGKVIGGGFPVGAYAARKDIMAHMAPEGGVYQAGTLAANPIGMVAGLTTLKKLEEHNVQQRLEERTTRFAATINEHIAKHNLPWQMIHYSSLFWLAPKTEQPIKSPRDFPDNMTQTFAKYFRACLKRGMYQAPNAYEVGFMSWAHDDNVLAAAQQIIVESLKEASETH